MTHFQGFRPGDLVDGRYQIVEEIGRGGFGVVYTARQMAIDRIVALKILLPEADTIDPQAVERFKREAVLISSLESPNTITLIEFGQTDQGALYTVMEYARGDTLRDILGRGKLDAKRCVRIASQVLLSLYEAHQRGIIHRDLKPANIMVGEFAGQHDHVKVLDFGIAKILKSGDTESTLALTGRIVGTPRYMSPEQLRGANPTPGSDLYAMGLIMYEMLLGGPAIRVTDAMAQVEAQMKKESFRLPQLPGVPLNLVTSINRAMEKDPAKRYKSAQTFKDDLETAISGRPLQADPNKTRVRGAIDGPVEFQSRGGSPTAEYDDEGGGGFGAFLVAAVVLFMLALGGAAFLLLSDSGGSASESGNTSGESSGTQQGQEAPEGAPEEGASEEGAGTEATTGQEEASTRRPLPTPRDSATAGAGTPSGEQTAPSEGGPAGEAPPTDTPSEPAAPTPDNTVAAATPEETTNTEAAATPTEEAPPAEEAVAAVAAVVPAPAETVPIEINADPGRVSVYINDDRICRRTPCTVEVPADGSAVNLRVSKSGYHSDRRSISASDGPNLSINLRRRQQVEEEEPEPSTGGLVPL